MIVKVERQVTVICISFLFFPQKSLKPVTLKMRFSALIADHSHESGQIWRIFCR